MLQFIRFKIAIIGIVALLVSLVCRFNLVSFEASMLTGWLTFGGLYLLLSFVTMINVKSSNIVDRAEREDLGVWMQFLVLLGTCVTALITIIFWRNTEHQPQHFALLHQVFFIVSITLAWLVLHVSFLFRYAHMYYGDKNSRYQRHIRGLEFPHDSHPDYFDFAYYSFTIGMTFQVSDVVIKSKGIRRLTLLHSLLSFLFNTILIAITINEIVNL